MDLISKSAFSPLILMALAGWIHGEETVARQSLSLELVRTIDTKPFAGGSAGVTDSESLAYCQQDDTFWIADDDGKAAHQFARSDGRFIVKVTAADLVTAFPAVDRCVNGTSTPCSYTHELEAVACDPDNGDIYIVNTVNDWKLNPPVDKQAIFKFRKAGASVVYDSWHPLPPGIKNTFSAIIVIDGTVYGGGDKALVEYDFQRKAFARLDAQEIPRPVYASLQGDIVGLGYESTHLWVLTAKKKIVQVDWKTRLDIAVGDLPSVPGVSLGLPKGLQTVSGKLYVVDGDPPHKIFVLGMK